VAAEVLAGLDVTGDAVEREVAILRALGASREDVRDRVLAALPKAS
jgi:hypothetical protein